MNPFADTQNDVALVTRTTSRATPEFELLLAAEHAIDIGARIFRQGRAHIGALIAKGDRDYATSVDLQIESAIKTLLSDATPRIPFLGEEAAADGHLCDTQWVLDPIDGTINFARKSPAGARVQTRCRSASMTAWWSSTGAG